MEAGKDENREQVSFRKMGAQESENRRAPQLRESLDIGIDGNPTLSPYRSAWGRGEGETPHVFYNAE